jgi:hypothetical protein
MIEIVRRPNEETVFEPLAAARDDAPSGVVEETLGL